MGYRGKKNLEYERYLERRSLDPRDEFIEGTDEYRDYWEHFRDYRTRWRRVPDDDELWRTRNEEAASSSRTARLSEFDSHQSAARLVSSTPSARLNHAGGVSYAVGPVAALKMISSGTIFGEDQYYLPGDRLYYGLDGRQRVVSEAPILGNQFDARRPPERYGRSVIAEARTSRVMERAIDEALDADFEATLLWAAELRERYLMRVNPQVILVRAAAHPGRRAWTREHPGGFGEIARRVMLRADDVTNQVRYWLRWRGSKRGIPGILKRCWARRVEAMSAYEMAKYGNAGIGLVDVVRICHAKGPLVDVLMRDGGVPMPEGQDTWQHLRASGMGWKEILKRTHVPHMALLKNLSSIFDTVSDVDVRRMVLEKLKDGARGDRQLPVDYLYAWRGLHIQSVFYDWVYENGRYLRRARTLYDVRNALENCMETVCGNPPMLPGRCAFLVDESRSTVIQGVSRIAELSATIGAKHAKEGAVFIFAGTFAYLPISNDDGLLRRADEWVWPYGSQHRSQNSYIHGNGVGPIQDSGEKGVWEFFYSAITRRERWDSIFIYSDMQVGHGDGVGLELGQYEEIGARPGDGYVDVNALVELYRRQVNPKVNVFCVQVAGYPDSLLPEDAYRSATLYGWAGIELHAAYGLIRAWDERETGEDGVLQ